MKVNLMFHDKDFILSQDGMFNSEMILKDLEIDQILGSLAERDEFVKKVCRFALSNPLYDFDEIVYRQEILKDCINNPIAIRDIYHICVEIENKIKKYLFGLRTSNLRNTYFTALDYLSWYLDGLRSLRGIKDKYSSYFTSKGFVEFFQRIEDELSYSYLTQVEKLIAELKVKDDMLLSAHLGPSLLSVDYTLRRLPKKILGLSWMLKPTLKIKDEDEPARKDIDHRKDLAINQAANALAQSADHLAGFFDSLKTEIAFYLGNLNYKDIAKQWKMPVCIPTFHTNPYEREFKELYDVALASKKRNCVVANDGTYKDKCVFIITGANQGGKTTFLRSFGQAQLMGQCGMLVGASSYYGPIRKGIFTHFKKEEDKKIKSGKLDEELERMSQIIDHIKTGSLVMFNESFSSTNEREGSAINKDVVDALIKYGNEVITVSHLYTFTSSYFEDPRAVFLIAERLSDGTRSHKIKEGFPEKTAYGEDLYKKVFG